MRSAVQAAHGRTEEPPDLHPTAASTVSRARNPTRPGRSPLPRSNRARARRSAVGDAEPISARPAAAQAVQSSRMAVRNTVLARDSPDRARPRASTACWSIVITPVLRRYPFHPAPVGPGGYGSRYPTRRRPRRKITLRMVRMTSSSDSTAPLTRP